jgi:hypothetical protein
MWLQLRSIMADRYRAVYDDPRTGQSYSCIAQQEGDYWQAEIHKGTEEKSHLLSSLQEAKTEARNMLAQELAIDRATLPELVWKEFPYI